MGFTDHDADLVFDGTTFEAASGFTATDIESAVGLAVDNLDVDGALKSDRLRDADLDAGIYDNAVIEIFRVNWQTPSQHLLMRYGNLGEVTRGRLSFRAEVRGLAHELQQPQGRLYQSSCDASFADDRCGLLAANYTTTGSVATVQSRRLVSVVGSVTAFGIDYFSRGLLTWTAGPNAGRKAQVKMHTAVAGVVTLEFWERTVSAPMVGDTFTLLAGCDKQHATCRDKFSNVVNFRGFPHIPGTDFALSYPTGDDVGNDGRSLFL